MASLNNVPKDILEGMRGCLDRRVKLSIKRLVHFSLKKDKLEKRVLAFSSHKLFVFTAKSAKDVKKEFDFHYLDIKAIESKRPNQLVITTSLMNNRSLTFTTLEADTDEVDHMITHIGTSLKTVFPAYPLARLIKTIEVQPPSRLNLMYDLIHTIEQKETGPCGGYTLMYSCMCDFHYLPYRDEVAWDVDTIYLSQDSRELCLRDFDHLKERDLIPIVSALVHNTWFTSLNANNVKLNSDVCTEVLRVMKKNAVIEALLLSNTGITTDFIKKLSTITMSDAQLHKLDLSNNPIEDDGAEHIFGALSSRGRRVTWLDLSKTRITSKGVNKISEMMSKSPHVFNTLQTLVLTGLTSGNKVDDLQNLYIFLASPNMLSHLDLSGTDIELDKLMSPLQRGCSQNIAVLKLARTTFSNKKSKDVVVQSSFKQFFASVFALKHLDLSGAKMPADAIKDLLLGISSNRNIKDVHLDISGMDLPGQAAQYLQNCLTKNISSLNLSNIGFTDTDLVFVLNSIGTTKQVRQLAIGGVFKNVKPKNLKTVMEQLVDVIQDEESMIESLSLADSKLRDSMNMIINALGSNTSLTEIDISGNLMGDLGARMLSKALQINNKLTTIYWDKNNTTSQGFEDVADALEKNFTLRKMPMPVFDASVSPEKNEQALQRIERLLQRNHSPQKYSSDQAYRLQQGFLISSTQQMVDRLVVQSQDTINALDSMNALQPCSGDIDRAKALIKDADNSKTLLPRLRDIAIQSQNTSSPVAAKLKEISAELTKVLESQMKKTVDDMLDATRQQCKALMEDKAFHQDLQSGCGEKSSLPKDFTTNILNDVDTGIFNELSELNLAVAAHVSDRVIEEVIDRLSLTHKTLTNHLNERKKDAGRKSQVTETKKEDPNEPNLRSKSPQLHLHTLRVDALRDSPKMKDKRKSMHARMIRPQSVIDREHVQLALDAERKRPTTVPQATRSGSRSPKNRSPKPLRSNDRSKENEHLNAVKTPKMAPRSLKPDSRSPSVSPRSNSPVPSISVTFTDIGDLSTGQEHIYDNAIPESRHRKHRGDKRNLKDGLDGQGPNTSIPSKPLPPSTTLPDLQNIEVNPDAPKLTHFNKDRARRPKNVRPTTRQSALPRTRSDNAIKVDENVDDFFSKPSSPAITSISEKKEDTRSKSPSTKSTPESKKKLGGLFNFGHKDKEHKDTKAPKESKKGGLLSRLQHSSPKSSPSPRRVSDVKEEPEEASSNNNFSRSTKDTPSPRGSIDKKAEKPKNEQRTSLPKSAAENISLSGSIGKKSDKSDSSSEKSVESLNLSTKSDKSNSLDRKSEKSRDKSPVIVEENEESEDSDEAESESSSESEAEEVTKKEPSKESTEAENGDVKKEVKTPLQPPPRTKRSLSKADAKKETASNETDKDNTEEKEDGKTEKEKKETEETNDKANDKEDDEMREDEVKEEPKEAESEKEKEEADKVDENKPLSVSRKPGVPGGIGFGMNIMADLKAKQEKRRSQMPSRPNVSEKTESQSSGTEEKKSPFGLHNLKPVSKTVPKENNNVPVKPSDNRSSSDSGKSAADVPSLKSKSGSGSSDTKTATPSSKPDVNVAKKNSLKDSLAEKPSVTPRPAAVNKPPPPTRPKPPVASNKPTPAPRKSLSSSDSTENVRYRHSYDEEKKPAEGGVVYDSATLKMSVKDKISKFRSSGNENEAGKGRPFLPSEKKEQVVLRDSKKNDSLPVDTKEVSSKKSSSLPKDATPADMKKGETTEAGDLDIKKVSDAMTDSGIVDDSPKTSMRDALSKFDDDVGLRKHGSLPRHGKQLDSLKENSESPKRPQSMFAAVGARPDSKKLNEKKEEIAEENDKESPTEEVILV